METSTEKRLRIPQASGLNVRFPILSWGWALWHTNYGSIYLGVRLEYLKELYYFP